MKVWDRFVRIAHWMLAACVLTAWITGEIKHAPAQPLHDWCGYIVLVVIALRIVWGWTGTRYARFAQFIVGPSRTLDYAKAVLRRSEPRYLGHNPLGGWMILALLLVAGLASLTGWLSVTDRYWGVAWIQNAHHVLSDALVALIVLHVAGVVFTSVRHRENLVAAMWRGDKRPPEPGDVA